MNCLGIVLFSDESFLHHLSVSSKQGCIPYKGKGHENRTITLYCPIPYIDLGIHSGPAMVGRLDAKLDDGSA